MKRRLIRWILVCLVLLLVACVLDAMIVSRKAARKASLQYNIKSLAIFIEVQNRSNGRYPASLNELLVESNDETKETIRQILHDAWNHKYEYSASSNGFELVVTEPGTWVGKSQQIIRRF